MSGQGTRYRVAGYNEPKPMIPVNGRPMIARLLESFNNAWPTHFVMAENHRVTLLPEFLQDLRPAARQCFVPEHSKGPSFAVLAALEEIPDEEAVLVSYCDYGLVWDANRFEKYVESTGCDACVICYRGFHAHYLSPVKYAYCRMEGEQVTEVREKGWFTDNRENEFCSAGAYYFRSAKLLKEAIAFQQDQNLSLQGEYYTSLTVEALLRQSPGANVRVFEVPYFFQWGTPEDLKIYEYWERTFTAYHDRVRSGICVDQVLMPMAGQGSRFRKITETPKPLIPVAGIPMFRRALDMLPKARHTVVVALESMRPQIEPLLTHGKEQGMWLAQTPPGQALSTQAGLVGLQPDKEVLVSSCDHGALIDPESLRDLRESGADAAVFMIQGYPGATRTPNAYSYVLADSSGMLLGVSMKKPLSVPSEDPLLVGTFWFRTAAFLAEGLEVLRNKDPRVGGELYLDSVLDVMRARGGVVRVIPLRGYIGWGDPDALAESLYWQEVFCGVAATPRRRYPI